MSHNRKISVIGLGYVGLPVATAFAQDGASVVAFDINQHRISELNNGYDRTGEVSDAELAAANMVFTTRLEDLSTADFHIVTVPTPIDEAHRPDLSPLLAASRSVGQILKKGDIVVYESTVYPGATEEDCVPVLEQVSGLTCGVDFSVGYSPERINPGDTQHRFTNIVKVVSGSDAATLDTVAAVYGSVVTAGIHKAPSIRVAEAAKVIENTQRDVNIALMNELALIFHRFGIDTRDVLAASGTKWNFLPFTPGLVGGHCIGVDPYYLTHQAEKAGHHAQVILSGRHINDNMGNFIARETIKALMNGGCSPDGGKQVVTVLGLTFKENVPDVRNTRVVDILSELKDFGVTVQVADPLAEPTEVAHEYNISLTPFGALEPADAVILAVPHQEYLTLGWDISRLLKPSGHFIADIKGALDRDKKPEHIQLWRL